MKTPDPNAKAPRPAHISSEDERRPDMDHPPPSTTSTGFDRATAAADNEARTGQVPGPDDFAATQAEGTADDPQTERLKHGAASDGRDADDAAGTEVRRK
ncbi:hypothetical protein CR159_03795 [Pollutimonas subterranea]|uniref:Uncharacterized protein n=1 Tax=Pollutimonas subterranea TaxID=2045210 RepID=A0A2N4U8K3_9BURK|nr:hypothetical protein [Pollutimonas subterranea]PLC51352.1 hypothetical protein CR159_03795 [Pollutimonas subterranea]